MSHFLVDVKKLERKKMLEKAVNEHDHLMISFVKLDMIRDGRKSFAAKV